MEHRTDLAERRSGDRRRTKAELRAHRLAELERRRREDAELLLHLVENMCERGTLQAVAAEMSRSSQRSFGRTPLAQGASPTDAGRVGAAQGVSGVNPAHPVTAQKKSA